MSADRLDRLADERAAQAAEEYWLAALPFPDGLYFVPPQHAGGRTQPADYAAALSAGLWVVALTLVLTLLITLA